MKTMKTTIVQFSLHSFSITNTSSSFTAIHSSCTASFLDYSRDECYPENLPSLRRMCSYKTSSTTPAYGSATKPNPPFSITEIAYAWPFNIISRRTRGAVPSESYIALFARFSTRAVHLEAVSDLNTSAFLAAFTRFSSRYALPNKFHSQNATNLRGAAKDFCDLYMQTSSPTKGLSGASFPLDHLITVDLQRKLTPPTMRQKFWPIHGKRVLNPMLRKCYQCFRVNPVFLTAPKTAYIFRCKIKICLLLAS